MNKKPMTQIKVQDVKLEESWKAHLFGEFEKPYMLELKKFLQEQKAKNKTIYPPGPQIFNALNSTNFENVKVVILGQDPYHGPDQAMGLSFSVPRGVRPPPSLQNIFKEIEADLKIKRPHHGDLTSWAKQGVLLLNATLTVEAAKAGSHQKRGWELFTDKIISSLNRERENIVFMLWGSYAQKKGAFIDRNKHCVLESVHPSPLSAHRGFLGCRHFSKANAYLESKGLAPIDWSIPN